ncbi:Arb2 domain-containing protein [Dendryphion nanum]|uniref:Arb2 domain-containing protein n=1 Tax=Dendryphion nanum TaxID=256645 RepID=A0A9P9CY59_9PLEO|nr:Arb2 domain-containing protein [Dendryphion nanum]
MFRLKEESLPPDASEPADLEKLGYFINDFGQIRMIDHPDQDYQFHWYSQERHNEVRREAMQVCQRNEVLHRLSNLGIEKLYLPQLTNTQPKDPHIPILAPPADILKSRKRIVVLINDSLQDLGILAYRRLQRELGVNGGSVVNFAKEMITRSVELDKELDITKDRAAITDKNKETPSLIVMNCGQPCYSYKENRALSLRSWATLPRKSISHDTVILDPVYNFVPGHRNAKEHIKTVFDQVINNPDFVSPNAEIFVIGIENGAENFLEMLNSEFGKYAGRITAMAVVNSLLAASQLPNPKLRAFLRQRTRQWRVATGSNDPKDCIEVPTAGPDVEIHDSSTPSKSFSSKTKNIPEHINWLENNSQAGTVSTLVDCLKNFDLNPKNPMESAEEVDDTTDQTLCPTFADDDNPTGAGECIFTSPLVRRCILEFFEEVVRDPVGFRNPKFQITAHEPKYGNQFDESGYQPLLPPEMSPEHMELHLKQEELATMKSSFAATPTDRPELQAGRQGLEKRIAKTESDIEVLEKKTLANGGMKAGEAPELRDNWKTVGGGPKIPFAGTMVDAELVRDAGLLDTVEEALEELDSGTGD